MPDLPIETHVLTLPGARTRAEAEYRAQEYLARILSPGGHIRVEARYYNRATGEAGVARASDDRRSV